jgi:hypothetical protein
MTSASVTGAEGVTNALTVSPQCESGTPITTPSATPGQSHSTFSTSGQYTFSPPVMIMSLSRSST